MSKESTLEELVKRHGDFKTVTEKSEWFDNSAKPKNPKKENGTNADLPISE